MKDATHYSNGLGKGRGVCGLKAFSLTQRPSRVTCSRCRHAMGRMHRGELPWPKQERTKGRGR